jgi:hypothetical protein
MLHNTAQPPKTTEFPFCNLRQWLRTGEAENDNVKG